MQLVMRVYVLVCVHVGVYVLTVMHVYTYINACTLVTIQENHYSLTTGYSN